MVHYLFMIKTSFFIHAFVLATVTLSGEQIFTLLFTSDSFFEILFYIVYYFWQSGIFALCVFYLLSNSIKLWWRAQFTSEAYLSPFSSGFRQLWRGKMTRSLISTRLWLACTDWWLMGSHSQEAEDGRCSDRWQWLRGEDGNCGIKTSPLKYSRELLLETRQLFWEMEVIKS